MAAKQVVKAVDWSQLLQRTTAQNRGKILAFKNKTDNIIAGNLKAKQQERSVNWHHYETSVADKELVADFKKKFESFKVPEPVDTKSAQLAEKAKADSETVKSFVADCDARISQMSIDLNRLLSLPASEQLTVDDVMEHFPQRRPDYQKYPYWPHRSMEDVKKFYQDA